MCHEKKTMTSSPDLTFVLEHADDDPKELLLHANRYPGIDIPWCASQIEARRKIRSKLPSWYAEPRLHYPTGLSLEQASSETTARYKAELMAHSFRQRYPDPTTVWNTADLTGGLGIDSCFLARLSCCHLYVERQQRLCQAARHNFRILGLHERIRIREQELTTDQLATVLEGVHTLYLDPARRSKEGGRVYSFSDCEPDLMIWKPLLLQQQREVWVKLSPMIDLTATLKALPETTQVHVIAVNHEVKELLFCLRSSTHAPDVPAWDQVPVHCVNLHPTDGVPTFCFRFTLSQERTAGTPRLCLPDATDALSGYLLEPDKSLLKAGAFKSIAHEYALEKLSTHTHLYLSPMPVADFPGQSFRIVRAWEFNKRSISELQALLPDLRANVTARHFPLESAALQQKMKLKNGDRFHVFATTLEDRRKIMLLTVPLSQPPGR